MADIVIGAGGSGGSPSTLTSPVTTNPLAFSGALTFSKPLSLNAADAEGFVYRTGTNKYGYFGIGRTDLDGVLGAVSGLGGQIFSNSAAGDISVKGMAASLLMGTGGNNPATINVDTSGATLILGRTPGSRQFTVKGAASQSVNLFEAQTSAGAGTGIAIASSATQLAFPSGTTNATGLAWAGDTYLFRSAANTVTTGNLTTTGAFTFQADVFQLVSDGTQRFYFQTATGTTYYKAVDHVFRVGNNNTDAFKIDSAGIPNFLLAANAQTTVGAAGGASALPATPTKFFKVLDSAGTTLVIPAYAA